MRMKGRKLDLLTLKVFFSDHQSTYVRQNVDKKVSNMKSPQNKTQTERGKSFNLFSRRLKIIRKCWKMQNPPQVRILEVDPDPT